MHTLLCIHTYIHTYVQCNVNEHLYTAPSRHTLIETNWLAYIIYDDNSHYIRVYCIALASKTMQSNAL